jgi:thioredoxin-like negative regulator of GroEL
VRRRRPGDGDDRRAPELSSFADVTAAELEELLRRDERLVLVEFWTRGCEPCRELRPRLRLRGLAERQGDVCLVVAVEAGEEPEAVERHGVRVFPTLVFFKRGRELHRLKGGAIPESTLRRLEEPL